jgi:hypothetical protein
VLKKIVRGHIKILIEKDKVRVEVSTKQQTLPKKNERFKPVHIFNLLRNRVDYPLPTKQIFS